MLTYKIAANGPAGPLRLAPIQAETSSEAWVIAEREVRKVERSIGRKCTLYAVVWSPDAQTTLEQSKFQMLLAGLKRKR